MKLVKAGLGLFLLGTCVLWFSADVLGQAGPSGIKAGKRYKQLGAKLISPNEPNWRIVKAEAMETAFEKETANKKFKAFVKTAKIPIYETDKELFMSLEKLKIAEVDETNRDSIHYNYAEYKNAKCVQYDGIFNAPNTGYKYMNMNGYICRHPDDPSTMIQLEFSNFSNDRGYLGSEFSLSKSFFEGVQFVKPR